MLVKAKYCEKCGEKMFEDAKFCIMCGAQVPAPIEVPEPEPELKPEPLYEPEPQSEPDIVKISEENEQEDPEGETSENENGFVKKEFPHDEQSEDKPEMDVETLHRKILSPFDSGEETIYIFPDENIQEESIEQKFSRMAAIAVLTKVRTGEKKTIDRPEFVLGKNPNHADFAIRDNNTVSRIHASVKWSEEGYRIIDLGSMNGTFVNGVRVDSEGVLLNSGDTIELSDEIFGITLRSII